MKTKSVSILAITLALIFFVSSCKKYEEGPSFTLLTVKQRLAGTWELKNVIIDGQEMDLNDLSSIVPPEMIDSLEFDLSDVKLNYIRVKIEKDGTGSVMMSANVVGVPFSQNQLIEWQLDDDKENLTITINAEPISFEIIKLTKSELWLITTETLENNQESTILTKYEKLD